MNNAKMIEEMLKDARRTCEIAKAKGLYEYQNVHFRLDEYGYATRCEGVEESVTCTLSWYTPDARLRDAAVGIAAELEVRSRVCGRIDESLLDALLKQERTRIRATLEGALI